jgi:[acyl-carrier-protein] S-malonyltransferase
VRPVGLDPELRHIAEQAGGAMPEFALLFPGQGSQYVGMGQDLYNGSPAARRIFDEADRLWQGQLKRIIFEGPTEELTDTANAQPSLFVTSLACWSALCDALGSDQSPQPACLAGHSLGEYTALAVAEAFSFSTGLELVQERGRAMKAAGEAGPGCMAAILALDVQTVDEICRQAAAQTGGTVVIANDNAPGQIVISGTHEAVQAAGELAKALGAKRVVPLAVSIAAHSPLMTNAAARFASALRRADLRPPRFCVVGNRDAQPLASVRQMLAELEGQLTSRVRWTASVQYMVRQGISTFVEVGPKDVLTGLLKRIAPGANGISCGNLSGVEQAAQLLRQQAAGEP